MNHTNTNIENLVSQIISILLKKKYIYSNLLLKIFTLLNEEKKRSEFYINGIKKFDNFLM